MGTTRLQARFFVNVTLTDVDSAVFADAESATYGVRRTDTNASVVAAGTALTRLSTGTYYKDITDPAPDLTYQWAVRWVRAGKANAYGYFTTRGSTCSVPVSNFFTWQQFVNRYGLSNVIKTSVKDRTVNTGSSTSAIPSDTPNWYAVQDAFSYADDEVSGNLRGGVLKVPLDFTPNGGTAPFRLANVAMTIAWGRLYESRRMEENPKSKAGVMVQEGISAAYMTLAYVKAGTLQMPEAVAATDADVKAVTACDVFRQTGQWRYLDGQFTYVWG